jgi:NitT/TauT family transport system substrate-binding protein
LIEGWFRALDYLSRQPDDAVQRMAAREGMTPEQFKAALGLFTFVERRESLRQLGSSDSPLIAGMQRMAGFMSKVGMLAGKVDVTALIENPFPSKTP